MSASERNMDKKFNPGQASSPHADNNLAVAGPSVMGNDSFLEDMNMFNAAPMSNFSENYTQRHITKRSISPTKKQAAGTGKDSSTEQRPTIYSKSKSSNIDAAKVSKAGKRETRSETAPTAETSSKSQSESRMKNVGSDRVRRSGSYKENICSKNDTVAKKRHSTDLSKHSTPLAEASKEQNSELTDKKKLENSVVPEVGLLNAIKELITTYTKQESAKILRTIHDVHMNTLSNMIKNRMCQVDEIKREFKLSESGTLVSRGSIDNTMLSERIAMLELDLGQKIQEIDRLKQENAELKSKLDVVKNRRSIEITHSRRS